LGDVDAMADQGLVDLLKRSVPEWNEWRLAKHWAKPNLVRAHLSRAVLSQAKLFGANLHRADLSDADLSRADLAGADLTEADLTGTDLTRADLMGAHLGGAILTEADLSEATLTEAQLPGGSLVKADLSHANLSRANLSGANLSEADLAGASLVGADLSGAMLTAANLSEAMLVRTNFKAATLVGCRVYGASVWNVHLSEALQSDLIITPANEPEITVDNLDVAQFIYLVLSNQKLRHAIDAITAKVVLILGRFTPERKKALDSVKLKLRDLGYVPVLFDFAKPASREVIETVSILAHMSRFVIPDLTDAKIVIDELRQIIPTLSTVAFAPIVHADERLYGTFRYHLTLPYVLEPFRYSSIDDLCSQLLDRIINPAESTARRIQRILNAQP
jgi:uncharacterized protein YjbI with pentapeptide repeats